MESSPSPRSKPVANPDDKVVPPLDANTHTASAALPDRSAFTHNNHENKTPAPSDASTFVPAWRRPTLAHTGAGGDGRRPSVQFVPHIKATGSRSSSAKPSTDRGRNNVGHNGRRMSSPPPPAQFRPSVSFDTFANPQASDFSLTLNRKHKDYEYTKRSRTFLCGTDTNDYSDTALEWLIDELVDDGDEVVCLRVVDKDSKEATKWAGGQGEKGYRDEAERFLEGIVKKNTEDKSISLILEFAIGKVPDTIQQMIRIYEPAILVVGTRGRSLTGYQGLLSSGSVSKYCLQYSPVPVIVVRPSRKRESKKRKRLQDPTRTGYRDILDKSEDAPRGKGGHLLDKKNRYSTTGTDLGILGRLTGTGDPNEEARRVAEAIGYRGGAHKAGGEQRASSLPRLSLTHSDVSEPPGSPHERVLKSPELRDLDSPPPSDEEEDEYEDDSFGPLHESVRPEDEAAMLAYERAMKVREEEDEEDEAREKREQDRATRRKSGRSTSRGAPEHDEEGGGAAVLGLLKQLDRGIR